MIKVPCKNCERRELGCHDNCPDYLTYRAELDEVNRQKREQNALEQRVTSYQVEKILDNRKKYKK